jgi:hypothetical protein
VTDLFWPHCSIGEAHFEAAPNVALRPFPLYPVQQLTRGEEDFGRRRPLLFSFVGNRAAKNYLTDVRSLISDLLADDPRGMIVDRDRWHYQRIVYDAQILGKVDENATGLVDQDETEAFKKIMDDSVFSLCPSGAGPNSIRLWEAVINGSIPVIMSDRWAPPGDLNLWNAATVRCAETADAVRGLPERLMALAGDAGRLRAMRVALLRLARRYGPEGFVSDISGLMEARLEMSA